MQAVTHKAIEQNEFNSTIKGIEDKNVLAFIEQHIKGIENERKIILSVDNKFSIDNLPNPNNFNNAYTGIVNLKRANDIYRITNVFCAINNQLELNGKFITCVETAELRKERLFKKFPSIINSIYYVLDYLGKRAAPKLPVFRDIYYFLTAGRNRVLTSVEIYDGFSSDWGFSWGDVVVNTLGAGIFMGQQFIWDEQRVLLKYSYHKSDYAAVNPNLLGENLLQNTIKDYNGQTYWASANIASFLGGNNQFPKWLNIAVGYGADGMIGAFENPSFYLAQRERQYYLSLDIDLTRIKTKSKLANTVLGAFGFIKFPMPTVEFNQKSGVKFYPIYF